MSNVTLPEWIRLALNSRFNKMQTPYDIMAKLSDDEYEAADAYWDELHELHGISIDGTRTNKINELINKTLIDIKVDKSGQIIKFKTSENDIYQMYHKQSCCEDVYIDDICGDLDMLLNNPILIAEKVTNNKNPKNKKADRTCTWTFYKLSTIKGSVTLRWYGSSNGFYSEDVDFIKVVK